MNSFSTPTPASQEPFAHPQPAPISTASHAASPPTKQSLKSWWKGFRPPTHKANEAHGNSHSFTVISPPIQVSNNYFHSTTFVSKLPKNLDFVFSESSSINEEPFDEPLACVIEARKEAKENEEKKYEIKTKQRCPVPRILSALGKKRHSSGVLGKTSKYSQQIASEQNAKQRFRILRKKFGRRRILTPDMNSSRTLLNSSMRDKTLAKHNENENVEVEVDADADADAEAEAEVAEAEVAEAEVEADVAADADAAPPCEEITAEQKTKLVDQPGGIFGVPLRQSITYANVAISLVDAEGKSYIYGYVPIVVAKCGVYLKEKATNVEGIFRLSGSEKRIKELKLIFDSPDRYGKGLDWDGYTVHDASNVLRRYLNLLPEPIVPLDLYDRFREPLRGHTMKAVGDSEGAQLDDHFDISRAITTYQQLITELPPLNRQLLLYILDLLAVFASKSDENRMTSQNLAAIFQPGMLSHPAHDMAPSEYRLSQDVLIFLIENQDHFLIGMRGTAADERTVQEVQAGGTPPPATPSTPVNALIARSASNASAGAESIRKFGGVRRNVSTSSKHSRQSNGAPSPVGPTYGTTLPQTPSVGVHRSNTVPSKKSPAVPPARFQRASGSPSPTAAGPPQQQTALRGVSPAALVAGNSSTLSPHTNSATVIGASGEPMLIPVSLVPGSHTAMAIPSQERLSGDDKQTDAVTPTRERNVSNIFSRSPAIEGEKKPGPRKLQKRRTMSANPSAQSSTHSLHGLQSTSASPALRATRDASEVAQHSQLESTPPVSQEQPSIEAASTLTNASKAEHSHFKRPEHAHPADNSLKPVTSPASSLHSRSSFNDQSDRDYVDEAATNTEQRERRSRWRISRHRDDSQSLAQNLSPKKGLGADSHHGASTSSVGSTKPRKSFTADTVPVGSESALVGAHLQSSNDSGPAGVSSEEKKGPLGWIKNKMREKREEKEAEKDRTKSPPASTDRNNLFSGRGKSMDIKRDGNFPNSEQTDEAPSVPNP